MTWLHSLRVCFVRAFFLERWIGGGDDEQMAFAVADRLAEASGAGVPILDCAGEFQVAHLYGRYDNGDRKTILACRDHHQDIDQTRRWFRILTKPERLWLKNFLARRATLAWESLPSEERTRWDEIGARRFARGPREA